MLRITIEFIDNYACSFKCREEDKIEIISKMIKELKRSQSEIKNIIITKLEKEE